MLEATVERLVKGEYIPVSLRHSELLPSFDMVKGKISGLAKAETYGNSGFWLTGRVVVLVPVLHVTSISVKIDPAVHQCESKDCKELRDQCCERGGTLQLVAVDLKVSPASVLSEAIACLLDVRSQSLKQAEVTMCTSKLW